MPDRERVVWATLILLSLTTTLLLLLVARPAALAVHVPDCTDTVLENLGFEDGQSL